MKMGWKPPLSTPKLKRKRIPESIKKVEQRKKQKLEPVKYDPSVHTTKQQHLLKNFWDIDDTVLQSFGTIIDNRLQNEDNFQKYIEKQFQQISNMMRENGNIGPNENYTPKTFEEWSNKQKETLQQQKKSSIVFGKKPLNKNKHV